MMGVVFTPILPWVWIAALAGLCAVLLAVALWRRGLSPLLRALALGAGVLALTGPALEQRAEQPLEDIALVVVDRTASAQLGGRADQTAAALTHLQRSLTTDVRIAEVTDSAGDRGTLLAEAMATALAEIPQDRLAGVFVISDGQIHDANLLPQIDAPAHLLLTGQPDDWDRRLVVAEVPAFGVVGEELPISLHVTQSGAAPTDGTVPVEISFDAGAPLSFRIPVDQQVDLPVPLPHGGVNIMRIATPAAPGELTDRNNSVVLRVNGIRDRLRVLLISGVPHVGERTWRNMIKSDGNVDLVHFTILRPYGKQDNVPTDELSLIAFPTQELFMDKIDQFDLIIFDRYPLRGILQGAYLDNIRRYTEAGGAVLVAAGPDFAGARSLYRSAVGAILPASPTARVVEREFVPGLTDLGLRHPVTRDLPQGGADPSWGPWLRQIEVTPTGGDVVMEGPDGRPLLILDRVGDGRVALLASDHAWLWDRGYGGGGPQRELLRRLAHWLMKEPELEEDVLRADAGAGGLVVTRRTLGDRVDDITVTRPNGDEQVLTPDQIAPGLFQAQIADAPDGLYRLRDGSQEIVALIGPAASKELADVIADPAPLAGLQDQTQGGVWALSQGQPRIRYVTQSQRRHGRGWLGVTPREAVRVLDLRVTPLMPDWAWALLVALLALGAWLWEGRGSRR